MQLSGMFSRIKRPGFDLGPYPVDKPILVQNLERSLMLRGSQGQGRRRLLQGHAPSLGLEIAIVSRPGDV